MATNQVIYGKGNLFCNGNLLGQATSITMTRNSGATPQNTLASDDISGFFLGPASTTISVSCLVPASGIETDMGKFMKGGEIVELSFYATLKDTAVVRGMVQTDTITTQTDSVTTYTFEFTGGAGYFQ